MGADGRTTTTKRRAQRVRFSALLGCENGENNARRYNQNTGGICNRVGQIGCQDATMRVSRTMRAYVATGQTNWTKATPLTEATERVDAVPKHDGWRCSHYSSACRPANPPDQRPEGSACIT